jgi:hypothetical protein
VGRGWSVADDEEASGEQALEDSLCLAFGDPSRSGCTGWTGDADRQGNPDARDHDES